MDEAMKKRLKNIKDKPLAERLALAKEFMDYSIAPIKDLCGVEIFDTCKESADKMLEDVKNKSEEENIYDKN